MTKLLLFSVTILALLGSSSENASTSSVNRFGPTSLSTLMYPILSSGPVTWLTAVRNYADGGILNFTTISKNVPRSLRWKLGWCPRVGSRQATSEDEGGLRTSLQKVNS
jgi:hypothetical protein